jgi:small subunit ribosomal protein S20
MPQSASAAKRLRQDAVRRERNRAARARVRTQIRVFEKAVNNSDRERAREELLKSHSLLDWAAGKGLVKKNYSDRKKSRLTRAFNSLPGETETAEQTAE